MKKIAILLALLLVLAVPVQGQKPEIRGKSAVLMEVSTGTVLQEHNSHVRLAPASVTKVMTLLLIMEAIDSGSLRWEDPVTVSASAAAKGGSQIYLKEGEIMSASDMVKSIAVSSANDCACAMAEHLAGSEAAFVEKMNEKAKELGMEDTRFVNCTGLDDGPDAAQHRTSAYDIALMSRQLLLYHPGIRKFTTIWMDSVRDGTFGLSNTNKLVRFYPGCTGLKTGFTSAAGFCLSASALREGMELIAVVMGSETSADRFETCRTLLDQGFAGYELLQTAPDWEIRVPVNLGNQKEIALRPGAETRLLIEKAQRSTVTTRVETEETVTAPVSAGQKLGRLTVCAGDQVLLQIPLVAQTGTERLTWRQLFVRMLRLTAMAQPA